MYRLHVIHEGSAIPRETVTVTRAADILTSIPEVLRRHHDCERIEVTAGTTPLFAVDSKGRLLEADASQ
ncbi:hypothetical protein LRS10_03590 [Phenylobacterium sp. J426]|uniref:hypothetical protein n=1 Tax=Phenylobacterium sp. J426 TaxID=2898439 RepID=UPI002150EC26|nr:hypothetical protein [Phenylobacterium sp. J426]MCR5873354.1 hypothetical protein [Phenylobacterium sp. J426]